MPKAGLGHPIRTVMVRRSVATGEKCPARKTAGAGETASRRSRTLLILAGDAWAVDSLPSVGVASPLLGKPGTDWAAPPQVRTSRGEDRQGLAAGYGCGAGGGGAPVGGSDGGGFSNARRTPGVSR